MNFIQKLWFNQPVAFVGTVQTLIALAIAFGLDWSGEQVGAVVAALTAIGSLVAKSQVTPTDKLQAYADAVNAAAPPPPPEVP